MPGITVVLCLTTLPFFNSLPLSEAAEMEFEDNKDTRYHHFLFILLPQFQSYLFF